MESNNRIETGDWVAVLNEKLKGKVLNSTATHALIENEHGFEETYLLSELLRIEPLDLEQWKAGNKESKEELRKSIGHKKKKEIKLVDLHFDSLEVSVRKEYSSHQKLQLQLAKARAVLKQGKKGDRFVFVHGKGKGVLEKELVFLLDSYNKEKTQLLYEDADYSQYKLGAKEVRLLRDIEV